MSATLARIIRALVDLVTGKDRAWRRQTERERRAAASARETLNDIDARACAGRHGVPRPPPPSTPNPRPDR